MHAITINIRFIITIVISKKKIKDNVKFDGEAIKWNPIEIGA